LDSYTFKATKSKISKIGSIIRVIPEKLGVDTIKVFKNKKLISTNLFTVSKCDFNPIGNLSFVSDSLISINQILSNPYLVITNSQCEYNFRFVIYNFRLNVERKNNGPIISTYSSIRILTDEMISIIKQLKPGDRILFDEVKYGYSPNFCPRLLPDINVTFR